MEVRSTTLTLFLTALASLSTTQARIGQTPSTDNRMLEEEVSSNSTTTNLLQVDTNATSCMGNNKHACALGDKCLSNSDCPFVGPKHTACCAVYFNNHNRYCAIEDGWTRCMKI